VQNRVVRMNKSTLSDILLDLIGLLIMVILASLLSPIIAFIIGLRDFDLIFYSLTMIWVLLWIILLCLFSIYKKLEERANEQMG
jgi:uncharacterized protein YacL